MTSVLTRGRRGEFETNAEKRRTCVDRGRYQSDTAVSQGMLRTAGNYQKLRKERGTQ